MAVKDTSDLPLNPDISGDTANAPTEDFAGVISQLATNRLTEVDISTAVVALAAEATARAAKLATKWTYAGTSGGITDATGVAFKASAGTGKKNYISRISFGNGGAAGTAFAINDGASGTLLWTGYCPAASQTQQVVFDPPLVGTNATLLEIKLASATTVAVRFNAQGYTD